MRSRVKRVLATAAIADRAPAEGATVLIYHRIGGGTDDELDTPTAQLAAQLDVLVEGGHEVVALDTALDRLETGDPTPSVVLTFDDGFGDVADHAHPLLADRGLPYTVYLVAGLVGGAMRWEGSAATSQGAPALTWDQVEQLVASGLCTLGNHTFDHSRPEDTGAEQLDRCSELIAAVVGDDYRPRHFAWTWGVEVPGLRGEIKTRFRSAATGSLGRNLPNSDLLSLRRVPVRRTDPLAFFEAKLHGRLLPERAYARLVAAGKALRRA